MNAVLIDNWTLYNIAYPEEPSPNAKPELDSLENLLMAILLWDQIYFWDNGKTSLWKYGSQLTSKLPSLTGLKLPPDVEYKVNQVLDNDVVVSGAKQYQLIAEEFGIDYLPKRERYQYFTSQKCYWRISNAAWPKKCIETVEENVQKYYDELMQMIGDTQLRFCFPLLVDYIGSQAGGMSDYIEIALHMRETGPLYNMRLWIDNLHSCIDEGNWVEVKYLMKHVEDIVHDITYPLVKDMRFQVGVPFSAGVSFLLNRLPGGHKTQLTFLRDLASFALKKRPET